MSRLTAKTYNSKQRILASEAELKTDPRNLPKCMVYQSLTAVSSARAEVFLLQCRTRGANLPPQTDFHGCSLTAPVPRAAPLFRRTCVSVRLSVSNGYSWRAKWQPVPQPLLTAFSASLAAFSELVNTTVVLAARARQSSTNAAEVFDLKRFVCHTKFCVRLGPRQKCKSDIFHILVIWLTSNGTWWSSLRRRRRGTLSARLTGSKVTTSSNRHVREIVTLTRLPRVLVCTW